MTAAAMVSWAGGCRSGDAGATAAAERAPLSAQERKLNVDSFDTVWTTVKDRHWDPTLGGLDWEQVRRELRPKVEAAQTTAEARAIMREALSRLGQSHFGIIERDAYEHVAPAQEMAAKSGGAKAAPAAPSYDGQTGLDIRVVDGKALVVEVDSESGAAAAGVKPGWIVQSVGDKPLAPIIEKLEAQFAGKEAAETMVARGVEVPLRGGVGDELTVTFLDGQDQAVEKKITLTPFPGEESKFGNLPPVRVRFESTRLPGNVGYIRFNYFLDPAKVMAKFSSAMESFNLCEGVIIDLRGNPGGIGFMANGMGGFFVDKDGQKLGEMRTRESTVSFVIFPRVQVYHGPLAILVDGLSLSTSEIMAGGMQDIGRARVFGTKTGGAALPSTIEKLPNGDGFQFAVANYVSASGRVLEGDGVHPDEEVQPDRAILLSGKDPVVEAANRWIKSSSAASNH